MRLSWALPAMLLAVLPARAAVLGWPVLQSGVEIILTALTGVEQVGKNR